MFIMPRVEAYGSSFVCLSVIMRLSMLGPTSPDTGERQGLVRDFTMGFYNAILPEGRAFDQLQLRSDFLIITYAHRVTVKDYETMVKSRI